VTYSIHFEKIIRCLCGTQICVGKKNKLGEKHNNSHTEFIRNLARIFVRKKETPKIEKETPEIEKEQQQYTNATMTCSAYASPNHSQSSRGV